MKLNLLFSEVFAIPLETISDALQLKDIPNWDSMNHMVLIDRLESTFILQLSGDDIADIQTVGDARKAIEKHGGVL